MSARISKQIPRSDVSLETRREMRDTRAEKYPIVSDPDLGSLSAGPDDPTDEDLWGDPVHLLYPLAGAGDTEPDRARASNARTRFKQFGADQYSDEKSRAAVHERIVEAEIAAGAWPAFDADDPLDALLPTDIRERMRKMTSKLDKAFEDARARISIDAAPAAVTAPDAAPAPGASLVSIVRELGAIHTELGKSQPELATRVSGIAYTLMGAVHKEFMGEPMNPAAFGLPFLDVSGDPNYAPVDVPVVTRDDRNQIRTVGNPLATPDLVTVNDDQVQRTGPSPDAAYPGPMVNTTNVDPGAPLRIPEGPAPLGVPWEPAGIAKAATDLPFGSDN